jgi:cell filamentation protein
VTNYTYPGTNVLKNTLGAVGHEELERLEAPYVEGRSIEIALGYGPKGHFDADHLKALHHHLFQDVYEWAGHTRDERVTLDDKTVASEPILSKLGGQPFLAGPLIPGVLDEIARTIRDAGNLRGLSRGEFAERAADILIALNAAHAFREGNGRTQRAFISELAHEAGHSLDFTVVSKERMIRASIAANEYDNPSMMRRMFDEISDPSRIAALRPAIQSMEENGFPWNDYYLSTTEPGRRVDVTMAGVNGEHFLARTDTGILIGNVADLPEPRPAVDEKFTLDTPDKEVAKDTASAETDAERQAREEGDKDDDDREP